MVNVALKADRQRAVSNKVDAVPDQKHAVLMATQQGFCLVPRDASMVPAAIWPDFVKKRLLLRYTVHMSVPKFDGIESFSLFLQVLIIHFLQTKI